MENAGRMMRLGLVSAGAALTAATHAASHECGTGTQAAVRFPANVQITDIAWVSAAARTIRFGLECQG